MKKKQKAPKPQTGSRRTPSSRAVTSSTASPSKWIRIERPLALPLYVKDALQKLDEAGHVAYVVGGSVRDFLLGRETKDHDVATSAQPDELCKLFPEAVTVGKAFGVIKIPIEGAPMLEIATFRQDQDYTDHRHPTGVTFGGPEEDATRRDFTINALFYDPKTSRVLDCVGGMEDLKARVVRAIGDPQERFREDALRLLRAVRFTTTLGFSLDPATADAVKARARLITKISAERIRDELTLMFTGPQPAPALELLSKLGLSAHVLPELEALKGLPESPAVYHGGDAWKQTLRVLTKLAEQVPKRSPALGWAALLLGVGKPAAAKRSGGTNFNQHEVDGGRISRAIGERLKMSREDVELIAQLVENHTRFREVFRMRDATLQRFLREPFFEQLLALHQAEAMAIDGNLAFHEFCASRFDAMRKADATGIPKLLDGKDLIQLGLSPGPRFSEILRVVEDLALERKLTTQEEALEYVVKHFVK